MDASSKQKIETVNHPLHYQTRSGLEAIDVMEAFTEDLRGDEAVNTASVLKYICRWKQKNGLEDLKKARWYLDRLIEHVEKKDKAALDEAVHMLNTATAVTGYN